MDPHSFCADPDPAVLPNADPDPAAFLFGSSLKKFVKNYLMERFMELKKKKKIVQTYKKTWSRSKFS